MGKEHDALVTADWYPDSPTDGDKSINVVYVNKDPEMQDTYGQQILRDSSVVHGDNQSAHGNYWRRA